MKLRHQTHREIKEFARDRIRQRQTDRQDIHTDTQRQTDRLNEARVEKKNPNNQSQSGNCTDKTTTTTTKQPWRKSGVLETAPPVIIPRFRKVLNFLLTWQIPSSLPAKVTIHRWRCFAGQPEVNAKVVISSGQNLLRCCCVTVSVVFWWRPALGWL